MWSGAWYALLILATIQPAEAGTREKAATSDPMPVLLGLRPWFGPCDGGTVVTVMVQNFNRSRRFGVKLQSVQGKTGGRPHSAHVPLMLTADGQFAFTTPTFTSPAPFAGVLVSLTPHDLPGRVLAGPVFFRLTDRLAKLAPMFVKPCCSFKLGGGTGLMLSGATSDAPGQFATVRFSGSEDEAEVDGQAVDSEWGVAEVHESALGTNWHVHVVTPPWPQAEDNIKLEISWNGQQWSQFGTPLSFVESKSLFGEVAYGISEDHLIDGMSQAAARHSHPHEQGEEPGPEEVTVVEIPGQGGGVEAMEEATLVDKKGDTFVMSRSSDLTHLAEDLRLVHDFFIMTCAATVGSRLASCVQAPSIIGFLLGGVVVGPGGFDLVAELVQIESISELGVCLLLFGIGLELSLKRLVSNLRAAVAAVISMVLLCAAVVLFALYFSKTSPFEALYIGIYASLASTPLSLRAVARTDAVGSAASEESGQLMTILVTQDVILAGLLAGMPAFFRRAGAHEGEPAPAASTADAAALLAHDAAVKGRLAFSSVMVAGALVVLTVLLCCRGCRQSVRRCCTSLRLRVECALGAADTETFVLMTLTYAFSLSWLTDWLGLSVELGAFLAGFVLTSCSGELGRRAEHAIAGVRDTFVAWFFASIGLVVNPYFMLDNWQAMLSVVILVFVLKLVTGFLPLWLLSPRGTHRRALAAFRASWILAHISEFGFVLASKGQAWGVLSRHVYLLLIGANAVSLCLAPWQFRVREVVLSLNSGDYQPTSQTAPDAEDEIPPQRPEPHTGVPSASKIGKVARGQGAEQCS